MKALIIIMFTLAISVMVGCQSSSLRGGGMTNDVGFKISVPNFETEFKQGQSKYVTVSLERGNYFKQDVDLKIETSTGISVEPNSFTIKASDKPDMQIEIFAAKNAAFGEYRISIQGIPETGEPTSVAFTVKVAP